MTIKQEILTIVANLTERTESEIMAATSFEAIGVDSLDFYEIITEIEKHFDIAIPDETLDGVATLEDMSAAVASCLAKNSTPAT